MTLRCILCVVSSSIVAGLMLSLMAASQGAEEPGQKPDEKSDRAKKILEALDKPGENPMPKPAAEPKGKRPVIGKGALMNPPMQPMVQPALTPAQQIQQFLALADADGNGMVSRQEMGAAVQQMGPLGQQLMPQMAQIFRGMDRNSDGQISAEEAQAGMPRWLGDWRGGRRGGNNGDRRPNGGNNGGNNGNNPDPRLAGLTQALITRLDRNRDGKISELEAGGDKQVEETFGLVDSDQDKQLSAEEIYRFLQKTIGGNK